MDDRNDTQKAVTKIAATNPRQDRLRRALRENLKRRKAQARGRNEGADDAHAIATDVEITETDQAANNRDRSD